MTHELKAVLYSDAGLDQFSNPTVSGYGVHGYTYTHETPKKGTGNPKAVPTHMGYEGPLDDRGAKVEGDKVTVHEYVDIIGGGTGQHSSGESELNAFNLSLQWLKERPEIKHAQIYCDARFVTQGFNDHMPKWADNNWLRANGTPPQYLGTWKVAHGLNKEIKDNTTIRLTWMKGHNGNIGNETADQLATRGKLGTANNGGVLETKITSSDPSGYWNPKTDVPRILQAPRWYFDTIDTNWVDDNGYKVVYLGCHGPKEKDLELVGKPYSDNYLGVVKSKYIPAVMDELRNYAINNASSKSGRIVVGNLDQILATKEIADFERHGLDYHKKSQRDIFVRNANKNNILSEMTPQGQGYRMMNTWRLLERRLEEFRSGVLHDLQNDLKNHGGYEVTDITDQLYEAQGKKEQLKLKANLTSKVKYFDVKALFNLELVSAPPKVFEKKIRLIFGQDIMSRNQLAAIADQVVRVCVVTWRESDQVGRYATYFEMQNGDYGLWSRYEANYILHQPD